MLDRTEAIARARKLRASAAGDGNDAKVAADKLRKHMADHGLTAADIRDPKEPLSDQDYRSMGEQVLREATRRAADRPDQLGVLARLARGLLEWE